MKWYGFALGWLVGMIIQAGLFSLIPMTGKNPLTDYGWWIVQLGGLFILFLLWLYLDRKVIIEYYKSINWNLKYDSFIKWLHS